MVKIIKMENTKYTIRIVCKTMNRIHYFQFFDFETISDLKSYLIQKYSYPDYITISSKGRPLKDNEKIIIKYLYDQGCT